jgi:hypothetical protein
LQDGDTHVGSPSSARQYIGWPGGARSSREREARATDRRLRPRSVDHVRPIRIRHWSSVPSDLAHAEVVLPGAQLDGLRSVTFSGGLWQGTVGADTNVGACRLSHRVSR